jgi:hypothetical protein
LRLNVESDGTPGHAYIDKTPKTIWVWIGSDSGTNYVRLFRQNYAFIGSEIEWKTGWSSDEAVSVEFYDWGDRVYNYNNKNNMPASNHIATLSFVLDKTTGKFLEKR